MLFLLGEKTVASTENLGEFNCPICDTNKNLFRVIEKNYFTLFFIRILPLGTTADYNQCEECGHTYSGLDADVPLYFETVQSVLAYLLAGYGLSHGIGVSQKIFEAITGKEVSATEIQHHIKRINQGSSLFEQLKSSVDKLSWLDKSLIIEAAYLLVYAARPIEYEERLQINLVGNALGVCLEAVNAIVNNLGAMQYKGIQAMEIENHLH